MGHKTVTLAVVSPRRLADRLEVKIIDSRGRVWNPALHPRDSKGRFIETGGVARMWGRGLVKVVRALPDNRVEVQARDGQRIPVRATWLTMVRRPSGDDPTDDQGAVLAEDNRRTVDPSRGDGWDADDNGGVEPAPEPPPKPAVLSMDTLGALSPEELRAVLGSDDIALPDNEYDGDKMKALAEQLGDFLHGGEPEAPADLSPNPSRAREVRSAWADQWVQWAKNPQAPKPKTKTEARLEAREAFLDEAQFRYIEASHATNGQFFKPYYRENPDKLPRSLFGERGEFAFFDGSRAGTDPRYRNKYASEELLRWFAENDDTISLAAWIEAYLTGKPPKRRVGFTSEHG